MANVNPANHGTIIGRMAADPKVFANNDGSKKVTFTLYVDHNYTDRNGNRGSDRVPVEAFVRKDTDFNATPFASIHEGDKIGVMVSLRQDHYTNRNGAEVYELKAIAQEILFLESRSTVQARMAKRLADAEQKNQAAQAQAAQPVPQFQQNPQMQSAVIDQAQMPSVG